ncbi:MAG TPA: hypothetical protein VGA95_06655 [Thermodesulfobacteriota bacterium]
MLNRFFKWLREVNTDYGNLIIALVTIILIVVTFFYVLLTRHSLQTLEEQVSIIRKDYIVRSFPEIHILTPISDIVDNQRVLKVFLVNRGFQATGLRLKVIPFVGQEPLKEKIGLMYIYENRLEYAEDQVLKLGKDLKLERFLQIGKFEGIDGLLIYLRYEVPLQEKPYAEWVAYGLNPNTNRWAQLPAGMNLDMLEKSRNIGLLSNF